MLDLEPTLLTSYNSLAKLYEASGHGEAAQACRLGAQALLGKPERIDGYTFDVTGHWLHLRDDGMLQLLDNDNGRGLILSLDEKALTATVEAEHPTRSNACGPQGTARSTANGHSVVGCSGDWVREYDTTHTMVWEAEAMCVGGGFNPGSSRWYPLSDW